MRVTFTVTCPRCGTAVEDARNADPVGYVNRERRLLVACPKFHCRWRGLVITELVDMDTPKAVA